MYYGCGGAKSGVPGPDAILAYAAMECVGCKVTDLDVRLNKCPICFKWVCDNCAVRSFGRSFCQRKCADQFFWGDEDED